MLIKNQWYAVEFGHAVGTDPVKARIHGHDLVLYRDGSRTIRAASDVCVHRGGSLAGGRVVGGCIECPYHGWRYDADGRCIDIPANHEGVPIPKKARVDAYPAAERYGFVWVFLGDLVEDERPPLPEIEGLDDVAATRAAGCAVVHGEFRWNANYDRVLENAVDIAHTPFVHAGSFGNRDEPEIQDFDLDEVTDNGWLRAVTATVDLNPPTPSGLWARFYKTDGPRPPVRTTTGFFPPNMSMLIVRIPLGEIRIYTAAVPIDEQTTVSKFAMLRTFMTGKWADRDSKRRTLKIFKEDQPTVEGQQPELLPFDLSAELHVKSDAIQLAYRRWRAEMIEKGYGLPQPADEQARREVAVIPSPARTHDPELANAWVFDSVEGNGGGGT